jgi:hypothetical protein
MGDAAASVIPVMAPSPLSSPLSSPYILKEAQDLEGRIYYFDPITKATHWEVPPGATVLSAMPVHAESASEPTLAPQSATSAAFA